MTAPQPQVVTSEVAAVNERRVRVDSQWLNRSEIAAVAAPEVGQTGALTIKGPRFISGLRVLTPG